MDVKNDEHPWEELEHLVETGEAEQVEAFLEQLPAGETALAVSRMTGEGQTHLLTALPPDEAAQLIQQMPEIKAVGLIEELPPETAAAIVDELPSDQKADLVGDLPKDCAEAILSEMDPAVADEVRSLSCYACDVAGGLMVTEYLAFPAKLTVGQVVDDLRANADAYRGYQVQYAYVTGADDRLVGVLQLRDLLLAAQQQPIQELMVHQPLTIAADTSLDGLRDFFEKHRFFGMPVTDPDGKLIGVVRRTAVEEALADRNASDYRKTQGIIQEELRTMPVFTRSRRRLAWLSANIGLNVIAASVIAFYQDTLAQVIALAVFLPIISDMSGCSGNQAVAVSMRELAMGLVRPNEVFRVWIKEILVGAINGLALGTLIATVAWLWKGNPYLGLVVGAAMALNTMIAVSIGGTIPLVMKRMKMDPALASGPILTTVTDMCGFFLILSLATALLPRLIGS